MRPTRKPFLLALALLGCAGERASEAPLLPSPTAEITPSDLPSVWLSSEPLGAERRLLIGHYAEGRTAPGPRVAEHLLRLSPNLGYVGVEPGAATVSAGKQVIAAVRSDGLLRIVLLGATNTTALGSGELYRVTLERTAPGEASAAFANAEAQPLFAPTEANEGLRVGDPIGL